MKTLGLSLLIQILTISAGAANTKFKETLWPEKDVKRVQTSRMPASYDYNSRNSDPNLYTAQRGGVYMTVHKFDWREERAVLIGVKVQ